MKKLVSTVLFISFTHFPAKSPKTDQENEEKNAKKGKRKTRTENPFFSL